MKMHLNGQNPPLHNNALQNDNMTRKEKLGRVHISNWTPHTVAEYLDCKKLTLCIK